MQQPAATGNSESLHTYPLKIKILENTYQVISPPFAHFNSCQCDAFRECLQR